MAAGRSVHRRRGANVAIGDRECRSLLNGLRAGFALCEIVRDRSGRPTDYRVLAVNRSFERMSRTSRGTLVGRLVTEALAPDVNRLLVDCQRAAASGESSRLEYYSATLGRHFAVTAFSPRRGLLALLLEDARPVSADDLNNERLLAEIDATLASVAEGLMVIDSEGRVRRSNEAAARLFGLSAGERPTTFDEWLKGQSVSTPEGQPVSREDLPASRALRGESVSAQPLVVELPTGRRYWLLASAAPIERAGGPILGATATYTDVTQLHELREEREEYAHSTSHDLRGPLTVILGQAQLIQRAPDRGDLARRSAEAIAASARRMNVMIQDLVDSARLDCGTLRLNRIPIDLPTFAADLRDRLGTSWTGGRVVVAPAADLPKVLVDPSRLERILGSLIGNALKFSTAPSPVRVGFRREGDAVVTEIADQGRGIPPEDQPHLFERYFRGHNVAEARDGLGLGLYIARGLVEAQGGRIWFESEPGRGTTFWFSLPIAESAARPDAAVTTRPPQSGHAA